MSRNQKLNLNSFGAFLLMLIVILGCTRSRKTNSSMPSNQRSSSASEPAAPGEITAEDLFEEYQKNKNAADEKYKGKIITVRGTVDTTKVGSGNPYITMKTSSLMLRVQCIFTRADNDAVSGLEKGQTVRVRGRVFGRIGNVLLQDCELL
jgi:predicted phosphodiesterase